MKFPDTLVIWGTLVLALLLTAAHLPAAAPEVLAWIRPDWAAMVLLYWVMAVPQRVGMVTAWCLGVLVDSLTGSLLGQHALGFVIIAFVGLSMYERLRMYSLLQQALIVFFTIALARLLGFWIDVMVRGVSWTPQILLSAVTSAMLWPFVFTLLRALRRRFRIA
ncbi:MAG: rod shape-determining protein MreD [Gammaproteobacteria bacterium]|nr:MAG: rod shape-determining protein MreD [Gammaproteobacteria bacterium]